jgi:surface polysaccharide O-acyltransferase-like enzyme
MAVAEIVAPPAASGRGTLALEVASAPAEAAPSGRPGTLDGPAPAPRLDFLDALKVALTALVIAHHAGQAYGPTGGRWPVFEAERVALLGPFFAVNAAFFMGLFFLISGYFLPASVERKGGAAFLRDRLVRFGLPLLLFAGALFGPVAYADYTAAGGAQAYPAFFVRVFVGAGHVDFGHLWFLAHLLVYGGVYVAWRALARRLPGAGGKASAAPQAPPRGRDLLTFTLLLAAVSFAVRLAFPVDRWTNLLGVLPLEPAHLPQYLALFVAGVLAARRGWLVSLPSRTGAVWLAVGAGAALARYAYPALRGIAGPGALPELARGGLTAGSLLWSTWEAFICVGLCVGLVILGRDGFGAPGRTSRRLLRLAAPAAFGAYLLHILPVVGLQTLLLAVPLPPLVKFAAVTAVAVPLSFLLAAGLRRLPGTRAVL